jgi:hypothetical protein
MEGLIGDPDLLGGQWDGYALAGFSIARSLAMICSMASLRARQASFGPIRTVGNHTRNGPI